MIRDHVRLQILLENLRYKTICKYWHFEEHKSSPTNKGATFISLCKRLNKERLVNCGGNIDECELKIEDFLRLEVERK